MLDQVIQVLGGKACSNDQSELCMYNRWFLPLQNLFTLLLLCFWVLCFLIFFIFFSFYDGVNRKKEMQVGEAFKFHGENWGKGNAIHHAFFWFCSIFVYIDFVFLKHWMKGSKFFLENMSDKAKTQMYVMKLYAGFVCERVCFLQSD